MRKEEVGLTKTQVSADEMSDLATLLRATESILDEAVTAATELQQTGFYESGMALDKFAIYPMAFLKISDLVQHYARMASLIDFTANEFKNTDNYIASKVAQNALNSKDNSQKEKGGTIY